MSRISGFSPGKPSVGFKIEDGENGLSPGIKGEQLDSMLGAIQNGETDGI